MKKIGLVIAAMLITIGINAQDNAENFLKGGKIVYQETVKFEIKLEGEAAQFMRDMPKERSVSKVLLFNNEFASYENDKSVEKPEEHEAGGGNVRIVMRMANAKNMVYTDIQNKKVVDQKEFMTRMFLIDRDFVDYNWKITGQQKMILGYQCMEATRPGEDSTKIAVWFTPSIQLPIGPEIYNNLPGLVLAVDINDGKRTIIATSITEETVENSMFVKPKEGKKVTAEEYNKIVEEKKKEMKSQNSGGGVFIIRN